MHRILPLGGIVCLALLLCGCKSDAEKQMSEITDKQKEIVSVLKDVKDSDSAKAANTKLKAIAKDLEAAFERSKSVKTSIDEQKQLQDKYKPQLEQVAKDIQAEGQRIAKIPAAQKELMDGMMAIRFSAMKAQMDTKK
jgi:DNA repair ATPase RecN